MPNVLNEFAGDGVTRTFNFSMTGGYLSRDYVYFFTRPNDDLLNYTPYNDDDVTWLTDFSVRTANPIPVGTTFVILRSTTLDPLVDFQNTSRITEKNLDTATAQAVHIAAETSDTVGRIQVVATDAKRESADALLNAQAAADDAQTAASAAIAASQAAGAAQASALQAGADAEAAALSAQDAATTATAAEGTANSAAAAAATAVNTANTALNAASTAVSTSNAADAAASAAVATATSANATAGVAASDASSAVSAATTAVGTANTAMSVANEAKSRIDEAVSGAVVSFNGRAGIVTPEVGDYTKAMVGLGAVDNVSSDDLRDRTTHTGTQPISTVDGLQDALDSKVDKVAGKQLSTEDYTSAEKTKLGGIAPGATANSTDENLRDRATHTGTQAPDTIAGLPQWQANPTGVQSVNGGQLAGMRNLIINGAMDVWQRGNALTPLPGIQYVADRWIVFSNGAAPTAYGRGGGHGGFPRNLVAVGSSGNTATSFAQRIESSNCYHVSGKKMTVSVWLFSSTAKTPAWVIGAANSTDNFSAAPVVASGNFTALEAGVASYQTFTFTANDACAKGMELSIDFGACAAGVEVAITGVQLEAGEVATPFEHRPYGVELALCQRYYEVCDARSALVTGWPSAGSSQPVRFAVTKRTVPTVSFNFASLSALQFGGYSLPGPATAEVITTEHLTANYGAPPTWGGQGTAHRVTTTNTGLFGILASAEL